MCTSVVSWRRSGLPIDLKCRLQKKKRRGEGRKEKKDAAEVAKVELSVVQQDRAKNGMKGREVNRPRAVDCGSTGITGFHRESRPGKQLISENRGGHFSRHSNLVVNGIKRKPHYCNGTFPDFSVKLLTLTLISL